MTIIPQALVTVVNFLSICPNSCFHYRHFLVIMFWSASKFYKSKIISPFGGKVIWVLYASESLILLNELEHILPKGKHVFQ